MRSPSVVTATVLVRLNTCTPAGSIDSTIRAHSRGSKASRVTQQFPGIGLAVVFAEARCAARSTSRVPPKDSMNSCSSSADTPCDVICPPSQSVSSSSTTRRPLAGGGKGGGDAAGPAAGDQHFTIDYR